MAETTPPVPQKLVFEDGVLEVSQSFSSKNGLLHMTPEKGFFFGPNKPLTNDEIPDNLPEPYHTYAHEFVAAQVPPPPETPEADASSADESPAKTTTPTYGRRR